MKYSYKKHAPVETYKIGKIPITVIRCDLVPNTPLPPYLKMVELLKFVEYLKEKHNPKIVGYYAQDCSEWTRVIPSVCKHFDISGIVGFSKKKIIPDFVYQLGENVHWLSPNMYKVNYNRMRKYVESEDGFMCPMGIDHPFVVDSIKKFFDKCQLPEADNYIVPTGSGVCLSGILQHLDGVAKVIGVCSRSAKSVASVVSKHFPVDKVHLIEGKENQHKMPFPGHRLWEQYAWGWLVESIESIQGKICYINLGSS